MSAYQRLMDVVAGHGLGACDVEHIVSTYAEYLEEAEPHAVNDVRSAQETAANIYGALTGGDA